MRKIKQKRNTPLQTGAEHVTTHNFEFTFEGFRSLLHADPSPWNRHLCFSSPIQTYVEDTQIDSGVPHYLTITFGTNKYDLLAASDSSAIATVSHDMCFDWGQPLGAITMAQNYFFNTRPYLCPASTPSPLQPACLH